MEPLNKKFFYDFVRLHLFDGKLRSYQVAGIEAILNRWMHSYAELDDRWLAYMLATVHHETARTMQPIREYGGKAYFTRMYDPDGERPHVAKRLGNAFSGDGARFAGRGYVQLTGRANYQYWAGRLGIELVAEPDLALQPEVAAHILFAGMIDGTFTGRKLADYLYGETSDWLGARRIINGTDKASLIESHALRYYAAISYTT